MDSSCVATTETTRTLPAPRFSRAYSTSARQMSGACDGMPKLTAQLPLESEVISGLSHAPLILVEPGDVPAHAIARRLPRLEDQEEALASWAYEQARPQKGVGALGLVDEAAWGCSPLQFGSGSAGRSSTRMTPSTMSSI